MVASEVPTVAGDCNEIIPEPTASNQAQFQVPLIFASLMALAVEGIVMHTLMAWVETRMTGCAHRGRHGG
jgi:hypothetical protein